MVARLRIERTKLFLYCFTVFCAGTQEGLFRLVGDFMPYEGRVEVCKYGGWRSVCADEQNDTTLAASVCSALGYSREGKAIVLGSISQHFTNKL